MIQGLTDYYANSAEAFSVLDIVRPDSSGDLIKAQADAIGNIGDGVAILASGDSGEYIQVVTSGTYPGFSGLTPGATYYLSQGTAGAMTTTRPTSGIVQKIGTAHDTTSMNIVMSTETDSADPGSGSHDSFKFTLGGTITAQNDMGIGHILSHSGVVTAVKACLLDAGDDDDTKIDINLDGVSIFSDQTDRVTITGNASNDRVVVSGGSIGTGTFSVNSFMTVDIDTIASGTVTGLLVSVEVQYD